MCFFLAKSQEKKLLDPPKFGTNCPFISGQRWRKKQKSWKLATCSRHQSFKPFRDSSRDYAEHVILCEMNILPIILGKVHWVALEGFSLYFFFFKFHPWIPPPLLDNVVTFQTSSPHFVRSPFRFQLNSIILHTKTKRFSK